MWNYMCIRWWTNWSDSTKMHGATIRFIVNAQQAKLNNICKNTKLKLLKKYKLNCENCNITLTRNKAPWWWTDRIETCRSVLKVFYVKLYVHPLVDKLKSCRVGFLDPWYRLFLRKHRTKNVTMIYMCLLGSLDIKNNTSSVRFT